MLDFSRQYQQVRAEILTAIEQVCDSQHFILGQQVQEFEAAAARFCDVAHACRMCLRYRRTYGWRWPQPKSVLAMP